MSKTKNQFNLTKEMEKTANKLLSTLDAKCRAGNLTKEDCLIVVGVVSAAVAMSQDDNTKEGVYNSLHRINDYATDSASSMLADSGL